MRRINFVLSLLGTLVVGPSLYAQSLWSPCGCPADCNGNQGQCCQSAYQCGPGNGCHAGLCAEWHDPAYFQPWNNRPFGLYNERIYEIQKHNGIKAQFVFHQFHFTLNPADGSWSLTQAGQQNAQKLARLWAMYPTQIIVEPSGQADWDVARRELALQAMTTCGVSVTADAFVTGTSHILGLVPREPETIFERRQSLSPYMQGVMSGGGSVDSSGTGSSSVDAGSTGSGDMGSGSGSNRPY